MIDTKIFFKAGIICFGLIAFLQLVNLIIFFNDYSIPSILISTIQIIFSWITSGFFYYLYKTSFGEKDSFEESTVSELKEAFKSGKKQQ